MIGMRKEGCNAPLVKYAKEYGYVKRNSENIIAGIVEGFV